MTAGGRPVAAAWSLGIPRAGRTRRHAGWTALACIVLLAVPHAAAQQDLDTDVRGDVRPGPGAAPVDEPDIDLLEARLLVDGEHLVLGVQVAGRPAFDATPTHREVAYVWVVAFDAPAGTLPSAQQDAIVVCRGREGGQADCEAEKGPFSQDDIDAGVFEDTLTVALRLSGPVGRPTVGAASSMADGNVTAQDFTPGAEPQGGPTTQVDETPWPFYSVASMLVAAGLRRRA